MPVELYGYGDKIVQVAQSHLGAKEIGWNAGDYVRDLLAFVGVNRPAPWCTAVAVDILHEAAKELGATSTCPRYASGAKLWQWALRNRSKCTLITRAQDLAPGDVVIQGSTEVKAARIKLGKLASGHTWIAGSKAYREDGWHVSYEGNTSLAGSREGQGFYARTRLFNAPLIIGAIRFQALYQMGVA